jgi:hypothetical protein
MVITEMTAVSKVPMKSSEMTGEKAGGDKSCHSVTILFR